MKKRIIIIAMALFMLSACLCQGAGSIALKDVRSTNYERYIKPVSDAYGFNIGECTRKYLPHEEYFYGRTYDHWNVDKVYDSTVIRELFTDFESGSCRVKSVVNTDKGIRITWKGIKGATGYEIERRTGIKSWKLIKTTGLNTYLDTGASKDGQRYQYRIRGVKLVDDRKVESLYSDAAGRYRLVKPDLKAVKDIDGRKIRITWHASRYADGYQVKCVGEKSSRVKNIWGRCSMSTVIGGLASGKTYSVYVRCIKEGEYSSWSKKKQIKVK